MEQGIRGKADAAELKKLAEDKASSAVVNELVKRLNKLEEKVKFELADGDDKASLSGSEAGDGDSGSEDGHRHHPNAIKEEDEEDDGESEKPKPKRRPHSGQQKTSASASPTKQPTA